MQACAGSSGGHRGQGMCERGMGGLGRRTCWSARPATAQTGAAPRPGPGRRCRAPGRSGGAGAARGWCPPACASEEGRRQARGRVAAEQGPAPGRQHTQSLLCSCSTGGRASCRASSRARARARAPQGARAPVGLGVPVHHLRPIHRRHGGHLASAAQHLVPQLVHAAQQRGDVVLRRE